MAKVELSNQSHDSADDRATDLVSNDAGVITQRDPDTVRGPDLECQHQDIATGKARTRQISRARAEC